MRRILAACGALVLAGVGCETAQRVAWQSGLPFVPGSFEVASVERRAGIWLDARLESGSLARRIFALADDPACASMLVAGQSITWARTEPFGPLSHGDARCRVVGLGDLETWRNARSRVASTSGPIRSARTRFRILRRDEQFTYAQGGFGLARFLGWTPGTDQVVALLPRDPACDSAPENQLVTMEFRTSGTPALSLITPNGRCAIDAVLATPPVEPEPTPAG